MKTSIQSPKEVATSSPPRANFLPTMYDLPSENPKEPGLPDEFHDFQPELLRRTFKPPHYLPKQVFSGSDLNLYYDLAHTQWYKRPDWFGVVRDGNFYESAKLRRSYVMWQERVPPIVIVELLSPGTEGEDLGKTTRQEEEAPTKWEVYEEILQVPYYVVFNRYTGELRAFFLDNHRYEELPLTQPRIWMPKLELGLGLWEGIYETGLRKIEGLWLRWYDLEENWILTDTEIERQRAEQERQQAELERQRAEQERQRAEQERQQAELERQRAEQERQRAERLAEKLRELNIDPNGI